MKEKVVGKMTQGQKGDTVPPAAANTAVAVQVPPMQQIRMVRIHI